MALAALRRRIEDPAFVRAVAGTYATRVALVVLGMITSIIVARALGPAGRGLYAVALTVGAVGVQFGHVGLHAANTYYVARDRRLLPALLGNSLVASLVVGGVGSLLAWGLFLARPGWAPVHGLLLALALLWVPFGLGDTLLQNLLIGIDRVRAYNVVTLVTKVLGLALLVVVVLAGWVNVPVVFATGLATVVTALVWQAGLLRRLAGAAGPSVALFRSSLRYGGKAYLANFFSFLVLELDILMLQYLRGAEATGYYSIAAAMGNMVYMLPVVIGTILFPRLAAEADVRVRWRRALRAALGVGVALVPGLVGLALLARPLVSALYGVAFAPAVPPFLWLAPGLVFLSLSTVLGTVMGASGMPAYAIVPSLVAAALNVALNLVLIPRMGATGAALASTITYFCLLVLTVALTVGITLRHGDVAPREPLPVPVGPPTGEL